MEPDVLYAVRYGEANEPLKLSLRSLANLPHRKVFIAGYCPTWVREVCQVVVPRRANKFDSIEENVRRALRHPEMGDEVVYMNDDFYITRPVECVPVTHGGSIDSHNGQQELKRRMRQTRRALTGEGGDATGLLTYDGVHMPLPLGKAEALTAIGVMSPGMLWRTWYGNVCQIGGEEVVNAKYKGKYPVPTELPTFLSTNSGGLKVLRERLHDELPRDCRYLG